LNCASAASDRGEVSRGQEHSGGARRQGTKVEEALKNLQGVTSIAYTEGDPVTLAKALAKYAKDNPEFSFKPVWSKPGDYGQGDRIAGHHAVERRAVFEAAVPAERSVAASGDGDECSRAKSGGGHWAGVEQKKFKEA